MDKNQRGELRIKFRKIMLDYEESLLEKMDSCVDNPDFVNRVKEYIIFS